MFLATIIFILPPRYREYIYRYRRDLNIRKYAKLYHNKYKNLHKWALTKKIPNYQSSRLTREDLEDQLKQKIFLPTHPPLT